MGALLGSVLAASVLAQGLGVGDGGRVVPVEARSSQATVTLGGTVVPY